MGTPLPTSTPTATPSALPLSEVEGLMPTYTPTSGTGVIVFGATDVPGSGESPTATPTLLPRATPTESTFNGWVASLVNPPEPEAKSDSSAGSILWGAGALAAMAGMTAYYTQKQLEEEAARHAAAQAQFAVEQAEQERKEKAQAKVMAKLEQQWEEERFKEQAYQQWKEEQEQQSASHRGQDTKLEREEAKEETAWEAWKDRSQLLAAQRADVERQRQAEEEKSAILAAISKMDLDKKTQEEYLGQSKDRELIRDKYLELFYERSKGMDDVEALSNLALFAVTLTPDNTTYFVNNMGAIVTGYSGKNPSIEVLLHRNNMIDLDKWYESIKLEGNFLLQKGYDPIFKDKEGKGNQGRHFWFYVQVGYHEGIPSGFIGNVFHETIDPYSDANEKSFQDYAIRNRGC